VLSGRIIVYQNGTYTIEFEKVDEFQNMDVYDSAKVWNMS
jgi:hypothetical protein